MDTVEWPRREVPPAFCSPRKQHLLHRGSARWGEKMRSPKKQGKDEG